MGETMRSFKGDIRESAPSKYDIATADDYLRIGEKYANAYKTSGEIYSLYNLGMKTWVAKIKDRKTTDAERKKLFDVLQGIVRDLQKVAEREDFKKSGEASRAVAKIKPFTICDILSDPKPTRFNELMDGSIWQNTLKRSGVMKPGVEAWQYKPPKWLTKLDAYAITLANWYEQSGGSKKTIIPKILEMSSCKNRAPWAAWSGKAWRGFSRSIARISKYEMTGEVANIKGNTYLVGTVNYKSRYGVQSWTDSFRSAAGFSMHGGGVDGGVPVVIETVISADHGFLSPAVSNYFVEGESEVLRCTNEPTKVKVYVDLISLLSWLYYQINDMKNDKKYANSPDKKRKDMLKAATVKMKRVFKNDAFVGKVMDPKHDFCKRLMSRIGT